MEKWLYYNSAADVFYTKKLCGRLFSTEIEFYFKRQKKSLFEPRFEVLRDNVCTPLLESPWSTSYSSHLNFFLLSLTVETLYAEICRLC